MRLIHEGFLRPLGALMAGAVLVLAFAPWQWAWLAPLALWTLLFLLRDQDPRRAFGIGYAFGLGQFGFGVSWVFVSIHEHGNAGLPLALLLTGLLIGFLALFPALVTAVTAWLDGRAPGRALWVFPAAWVAGEWIRTWIFTGFPWLAVGYTQTDGPLAGFAPLLGVLGLGALLVGTAASLEFLRTAQGRWRLGVLLALVFLWVAGFALRFHAWTQPAGPAVAVALVQGNIPQEDKWDQDRADQILQRYRELTEPLLGTPIIVWPEAALPQVYHELAGTYLTRLQVAAAAAGSEIVWVCCVSIQSAGFI